MSKASDPCVGTSLPPEDQPESDLVLDDQNSVNRAILMGLQKLNDNLTRLNSSGPEVDDQAVAYNVDDEQDDEIIVDENPFNLDIQADIDSIINPVGQTSIDYDNNEADIIQYDSQLDLNVDVKVQQLRQNCWSCQQITATAN